MKKTLAVLLTAVLASISWPANGSLTPLIFIAFVPMLWLEKQIRLDEDGKKGRRVFLWAWLAFALFNLATTWWVSFAHWSGTAATTVVNGGLMATCFWLYHQVAKQIGTSKATMVLPFLWMCVEYLHMDWDMSFPWLNLGYVFANRVTWIQWYEYTGVWGGTIWVWWMNAAVLWVLEARSQMTVLRWRAMKTAIFGLVIPLGVSYSMYTQYEDRGEEVRVVVVQPNIDPYTEKFNMTDAQTLDRFYSLARPLLSDSTDYLIGPETMIGERLHETYLGRAESIRRLTATADSSDRLQILVGASTYNVYPKKVTETARMMRDKVHYYDSFNSALYFDGSSPYPGVYHKSKLVVGVEKVPFPALFNPLLSGGIDLGGATGTLGSQEERTVFWNRHRDSLGVAPVVCWEADFPGYTAEYVRNGARLLFAVTNDGWWADTPGKDQHLHYARVRAIENRRSVARSANTGISCVINQRGDVSQRIPYGETGAFAATLRANPEITLFTSTGDLIGRVAIFISIAVVLSTLVKRLTNKPIEA